MKKRLLRGTKKLPRDIRDILNEIAALAAIAAFYGFLEGFGVTCPILFISGISCAGCGMSRAWMALLRGDISTAVRYHPLFLVLPIVLIVFLIRRRIPGRVLLLLERIVCALFLAVYIVRILDPSDTVVVFDPKNGLILRIFAFVKEHIFK